MATEKPKRARVGKHAPRKVDAPVPEATAPAAPRRQYVDIDPWAMLAELMETPEERPIERSRTKTK